MYPYLVYNGNIELCGLLRYRDAKIESLAPGLPWYSSSPSASFQHEVLRLSVKCTRKPFVQNLYCVCTRYIPGTSIAYQAHCTWYSAPASEPMLSRHTTSRSSHDSIQLPRFALLANHREIFLLFQKKILDFWVGTTPLNLRTTPRFLGALPTSETKPSRKNCSLE